MGRYRSLIELLTVLADDGIYSRSMLTSATISMGFYSMEEYHLCNIRNNTLRAL